MTHVLAVTAILTHLERIGALLDRRKRRGYLKIRRYAYVLLQVACLAVLGRNIGRGGNFRHRNSRPRTYLLPLLPLFDDVRSLVERLASLPSLSLFLGPASSISASLKVAGRDFHAVAVVRAPNVTVGVAALPICHRATMRGRPLVCRRGVQALHEVVPATFPRVCAALTDSTCLSLIFNDLIDSISSTPCGDTRTRGSTIRLAFRCRVLFTSRNNFHHSLVS